MGIGDLVAAAAVMPACSQSSTAKDKSLQFHQALPPLGGTSVLSHLLILLNSHVHPCNSDHRILSFLSQPSQQIPLALYMFRSQERHHMTASFSWVLKFVSKEVDPATGEPEAMK